MTVHVTVNHTFDAAHRIPVLDGAGAKCRNVHGHTFAVEWTFRADGKDLEQVEFGEVKRALRGWVDANADHAYICRSNDEIGRYLAQLGLKVMAMETWPTTEAIAEHLAKVTAELLPDLDLVKLRVREGTSNAATWHRPLTFTSHKVTGPPTGPGWRGMQVQQVAVDEMRHELGIK